MKPYGSGFVCIAGVSIKLFDSSEISRGAQDVQDSSDCALAVLSCIVLEVHIEGRCRVDRKWIQAFCKVHNVYTYI